MYSQCLLACICNQEHENGKLIIITSGHSKLTTGSIAAAHSWISDHIDYTISWYQSRIHRAYDIVATTYRTILRYHAWTHDIMHERTSRVCCSHTAMAASASDWCRLPCTPSVAPSASHSLRYTYHAVHCIGSLGWKLGDGSCTSGGLNYACRKAHCARCTA